MIRESLAHTPLTKIHCTAAADCYCLCGSAARNQSSGDWNWKIDVVLVEIERWKKDEERVVRATLRRRIRTRKRKRNERITQSAQRVARTHAISSSRLIFNSIDIYVPHSTVSWADPMFVWVKSTARVKLIMYTHKYTVIVIIGVEHKWTNYCIHSIQQHTIDWQQSLSAIIQKF